jgi:hypothetical protein
MVEQSRQIRCERRDRIWRRKSSTPPVTAQVGNDNAMSGCESPDYCVRGTTMLGFLQLTLVWGWFSLFHVTKDLFFLDRAFELPCCWPWRGAKTVITRIYIGIYVVSCFAAVPAVRATAKSGSRSRETRPKTMRAGIFTADFAPFFGSDIEGTAKNQKGPGGAWRMLILRGRGRSRCRAAKMHAWAFPGWFGLWA